MRSHHSCVFIAISALLLLLIGCKNGEEQNKPSPVIVVDKAEPKEPDIQKTISESWDALRVADFSKNDDKRARAMQILGSLANMPKSDARAQIFRELIKEDDMEATHSGLFQSMMLGPIDADILKVAEVMISDQVDSAARTDLVNQKLGTLEKKPLYYLLNLNISKKAPSDGPGVRLTTGGLVEETENLNRLLALLLVNGADAKDIFPREPVPEEITKFDTVLDRLLKNDDMNAFVALLRDIGPDELISFTRWVIAKDDRGPALKAILTSNEFDDVFKRALRGHVFSNAIENDLTTVVHNHDPVTVGGVYGFFGTEVYVDAVALKNFNRLIDKDFGLVPELAKEYQFGDFGPLISLLAFFIASDEVSADKTVALTRKKAAVRTVAQKLKALHGQDEWKELINKPTQNTKRTAADILVRELKIKKDEAEKLLDGK